MNTSKENPPAFGLIIIGDEILSGKRADKHLPKVIELLAGRGLSLAWARFIGDDRERITDALREAFASGDVVFSCGGIGATPDDHTRQCAAAALQVDLALHPEARDLIEQRMRDVAAEKGEVHDDSGEKRRRSWTVKPLPSIGFSSSFAIGPLPLKKKPERRVGKNPTDFQAS